MERKPLNLHLKKGRLTAFVMATEGMKGFDNKGNIKLSVLKKLKEKLEALPPTAEQISMIRAIQFRLNSAKWNKK